MIRGRVLPYRKRGNKMPTKEIYIVISQTGSVISKMLKKITGAEYNHVSVSLDPCLRVMYSFGRKYAYFPFSGGFVAESTRFGTLKRFSETRAIVMSVSVSESSYRKIGTHLKKMLANREKYRYDNLGLLLAYFNIIYKRKKYYYCSDFVREILVRFGVETPKLFLPIVHPEHFLKLPDSRVIYRGLLSEYTQRAVVQNV